LKAEIQIEGDPEKPVMQLLAKLRNLARLWPGGFEFHATDFPKEMIVEVTRHEDTFVAEISDATTPLPSLLARLIVTVPK
jgi:hypothetical protein